MKKLHLVSLGCPKNLVDSEVMLGTLTLQGYEVVQEPAEADLLLINTCGFITSAVEEGVDEILRLAEYKKDDPGKKLVVTGCMVQRYGDELKEELPEVDLFTGTDGFQEIDALIRSLDGASSSIIALREPRFLMNSSSSRQLSTPFFRSYLKVTEGCDNRCSYCMIPSLRGNLRSRDVSDLVREAVMLEKAGVKEITFVAQDLTAYGNDRSDGSNLETLLDVLLDETNVAWFRLLYLYPSLITDRLLEKMAERDRIVPYLDIPFQHFSDRILKRMNRRYSWKSVEELVGRIRHFLPDCSVRTSLMVGFPGESAEDFTIMEERLSLLELDNVGVFEYEDEEGAPAWSLSGKVEDAVKKERYDRLMEAQSAISSRRLQRFMGRIEPVLLEGISSQSELLLEGRTRFQAPEIDGSVYITDGQAEVGDIVQVRITETHTYDLVGEIISKE